MKLAIALGMGSFIFLTASTLSARAAADGSPAFRAEIAGEVTARPTGDARFGIVEGGGEPAVFTISLGARGDHGSVLFTRRSGAPLVPGTYTISDRADGTDDLRALVMTGSATRPTGVFRAGRGALVVTYASEREIRGTFRVQARGFLADSPDIEGRQIEASGSFTASHAPVSDRPPGSSWFSAEVRGAVSARHTGRVMVGPVAAAGGPGAYTITLGGTGESGAIVLTRLGNEPLRSGRYPVGESATLDAAGGFRVLYLAGTATRPEGVFRGESGTLDLEVEASGRVRGRIEVTGSGFVAAEPDDETKRVVVTAEFGDARMP
ncbi:MAG TPA: hypothetical protein VEB59_05340 [Gemmatimonadales bacterium]|nr:hypothetical protein [Gemmatimonadales bacterium]